MNVRHSPKKGPIMRDESDCVITTRSVAVSGSGSQPDLRQLKLHDSELQQVTFRHKRKHSEEDLHAKFDAFESKVMALLTTMAESQSEKLNTIAQDVSLIKFQVEQMKLTSIRLEEEQCKFKKELSTITNFNTETENRIKAIESKVDTLKTGTMSWTPLTDCDDLISEVQERYQREKNLIIVGIDEIISKSLEERRNHDMSQVKNVVESFGLNCAQPNKVIRIGKFDSNKSRPIKACFETSETPKLILRNKTTFQKDPKIKIYSDETPYQKKVMQKLRDELKQRTEAGEKDLTIKFIKGIPKLIQAKN
ncbi:uncharacterized protein LOC114354755 [Ostrinia furnacalis]|uniref:uncharacterized protein LOC114354755 n=1 Tax=Ostrinia furnacalis TaxID=93504 RepID=UPI0010398FB8|nr:uncharacterized protein LOC114354755 [Ostrinia furnacalis]